jgi:hypothetical protein
MSIKIYIPSFLSEIFGGTKEISRNPGKLSNILHSLSEDFPTFKDKFCYQNGKLKEYVTIFLDDKIVSNDKLEKIFIKDDQTIKIYVPLIGG